ncbi:MAG TPA: SDR family oxidoreductase [Gemmatimonadaceae bacterium]|nr:SDR family oxidoreductase [Gemmatimonadaceae bacterium]
MTKVVVITGASGGIGAALARRLSRERVQLVLAARRENELETVATDCRAGGAEKVLIVRADVTRRDDVIAIRDRALAELEGVDVWVNNAGRGITRSVLDLTEADVDEMIDVNVKSAIYGAQAVVPHFVERGEGHLINISSFLGRVPIASFRSVYSASKAALNSLTTNLRMDLRQYPRIHVSLVMPGVVTTDFARNVRGDARPPMNAAAPGSSPMKPQTPEEVADKIAELIAHPVAELYTNPASAEIARRYYANQGEMDVSTR